MANPRNIDPSGGRKLIFVKLIDRLRGFRPLDQSGDAEEAPIAHDGDHAKRVGDIGKWVAVDENEIRHGTDGDAAERRVNAHGGGGIHPGGPQRLNRRQAGSAQRAQLGMQPDAGGHAVAAASDNDVRYATLELRRLGMASRYRTIKCHQPGLARREHAFETRRQRVGKARCPGDRVFVDRQQAWARQGLARLALASDEP